MSWSEIIALYKLTLDRPPHNLQPRYNVCPTDPIDVVTEQDGKRDYVRMRWGLVPRWWSKPLKELRAATFNARAETVDSKPFFRDAFWRARCLIPASGYYEWKNDGGRKQPYYFTRADGDPLTFAGLWDEWRDHVTGATLKSCTIIVTEPNAIAAEIHDRMPVILERADFDAWLHDGGTALLKPAPNDALQKWPVSQRVNSSRADPDDATLIERIDA